MYFTITIKAEFCAAMKLAIPGPCAKLHGHTYNVSAELSANSLNGHGVVVDYSELLEKFKNLLAELDHKYLNEHDWFKDLAPSSENIAYVLFHKLQKIINQKVTKVSVSETNNCVVSYAE